MTQQPTTNASKPTSNHTWKTPHLKPNGNHPKRPHGPHRRAPQLQYGWIPTTAPHGNIRLRKLRIWIPLTPLCCNSQCDNITLLHTVHLQLIGQIKCLVLSCLVYADWLCFTECPPPGWKYTYAFYKTLPYHKKRQNSFFHLIFGVSQIIFPRRLKWHKELFIQPKSSARIFKMK